MRSLPEWRSKYCHLTLRRGRKIAKVAMARKLAVRSYWMMRKEWDYEQLRKFGSYAGKPGHVAEFEQKRFVLLDVVGLFQRRHSTSP